MSRGRRRDRRLRLGRHWSGAPLPPLSELKPLFESPAEPWSDPAIAPVLPLEGMSEWETIRLPALALEEPPAEPELVETSRDPSQLVLDQVVTDGETDGYDELEPDAPAPAVDVDVMEAPEEETVAAGPAQEDVDEFAGQFGLLVIVCSVLGALLLIAVQPE